jgi:gliding motility associated protien GldN
MKKILVFIAVVYTAAITSVVNAQESNSGGNVLKPKSAPPRDGPYDKEHVKARKAVPYTNLREADVMWSKRIWRVIDLREKINHPLYYPTTPILDRKSLFDAIKDAILGSGAIVAYNNPALDDEFKVEMTKSEVEALLIQWDSTNEVEDPMTPGVMIKAPIKTETTTDKVWKYWIKEDWFFDRQRSVLDVRIIGICPLVEKKTETGESTGADKALFWIYFPQARPILAKEEVYMRHNDAERRTMDDIFWKRMFSSYIRKETNVYDRTIGEYSSGLDALLESERIKGEIFNYEHDLWHY